MAPRLLVADDDRALLELMSMTFRKEGCRVATASSAAELRERLDQAGFDLVVCDIYLGDASAIDLLAEIRAALPQAPIILVTAQGTMETAAAAAAAGVFDYLAKPFELEHLVERVRAALRTADQPAPNGAVGPESMIVGNHPRIVAVYTAVARVARLPVPVLITGETGTGKELVARALHRFGARPSGPFVAINCGAIPEGLLESELFGHRRGAFTGADRDHAGAIASASGGTVFLDEVGELPRQLQVKLLRFLADGEIRPLGSNAPLTADSRVVAATNRELRRDVAEGGFREDLYYRLAGYTIELPPLRERPSDLPLLVEHFRRRMLTRLGLADFGAASEDTLEVLARHRWPGNVRELENVIQRAAVDLGSLGDAAAVARLLPAAATDEATRGPAIGDDLTLEELERLHIAAVLARAGGNRTRAAQILGIERKSLYRKARRLGIPLDGGAEND
jgi:DNA-binding NtrC family response regulator